MNDVEKLNEFILNHKDALWPDNVLRAINENKNLTSDIAAEILVKLWDEVSQMHHIRINAAMLEQQQEELYSNKKSKKFPTLCHSLFIGDYFENNRSNRLPSKLLYEIYDDINKLLELPCFKFNKTNINCYFISSIDSNSYNDLAIRVSVIKKNFLNKQF